MSNSPSGNRLAVGRSMIPGSPKLPTLTCRVSLAAAKGKNKNVKKMITAVDATIILFIFLDIKYSLFISQWA